jgi:MFS family permease
MIGLQSRNSESTRGLERVTNRDLQSWPDSERNKTHRGAIVALCSVQFVDVMCVTIVITALPQMTADFDGTNLDSSLIATAYATFFGGLLLLGARVGERFGHRRSVVASIVIFAVAAALAATAPSAMVLAFSRALQGAAAACAVPSALTLLTTLASDDRQRASSIAAWSASGAAAGIAGYVVSGALTQFGNWRLIFWSLLAVSAVLVTIVLAFVPKDPKQLNHGPFNLFGALSVTGAAMFSVVGATLVGEASYRIAGVLTLVVACAGVALFVAIDRRSANPLIPAALARLSNVRWGSATAFVNTATTSGVVTLLTLHVQEQLGYSPLGAAAVLLPLSVMVIVGSVCASRLGHRLENARTGAIGMGLIAVAIALLVASSHNSATITAATAVMGCGLGMSSVASTATGLSVPEENRTIASGLVNTAAQLGTALGTAALLLLAVIPNHSVQPDAGSSAPRLAWMVAATLAAVTSIVWFRRKTYAG